MATEVEVKRIGNSLGVILPNELVKKQHLKVKEKIMIEIVKEADFRNVFGTLRSRMSGQAFKDMVRKGWET